MKRNISKAVENIEVLDMRLEGLSWLLDRMGSYLSIEDDNANEIMGQALDYLGWSVNALREVYTEPTRILLVRGDEEA